MVPLQGDFKKLSKKQFQKLKNSIQKNGFIQPFFVWNDNGTYNLLDGHQRQKAILDLYGNVEVDCLEIQAKNEIEAKKLCIYYASSYADFNKESLLTFADGLSFDDLEDFSFPGLNLLESDFLNTQPNDEDDEIPETAQNELGVQLGDIYQLGDHRLMCGDSTLPENYAALCNNKQPEMMVTDPPYGVEYDPEWREDLGIGKRSKGKVQNDHIVDWTQTYQHFTGDVVYCWHAAKFSSDVARQLESIGFEIRSQIIWKKQHFAMSRGDYHWQHEPCWYAVRKGKKSNWAGDRTQSTVWDIKNNNSFGNSQKEETVGHGTQKPLECMLRPIKNHKLNVIYDPFGGSGTTLIACEKINKTCYMMELDPHYCSVIIKRWEKFTGKKAIKS